MALGATVRRCEVTLSDVERGVYETLDLRLAQHPSESERWLVLRLFAYCLSYEEGIAFSKGGLSQNDEPPVSVRDPGGRITAWIDVGQPSAERLHKARKLAATVRLFTVADKALVLREASSRKIHEVESIEAYYVDPVVVDAVASRLDRSVKLELVRNEGRLYVTLDGAVVEGAIERFSLADAG